MTRNPEFRLHISETDNFVKYDFDRKIVRKTMRRAAALVRSRSKQLLNAKRKRGNYPRKRTGTLVKSIRTKLSKSGFMARIAPEKIDGMEEFYPAFLYYGVKDNPLKGTERARARRRGQLSGPWRVKPRDNYMVDALQSRSQKVKEILIKGFEEALWKGK